MEYHLRRVSDTTRVSWKKILRVSFQQLIARTWMGGHVFASLQAALDVEKVPDFVQSAVSAIQSHLLAMDVRKRILDLAQGVRL